MIEIKRLRLSVKRPPIANLPADMEASLIKGITQDVLHMKNCMLEKQHPYSNLTIADLKELLQAKTGKWTQTRSREALEDML